jgi:hypothetical protein
MQGKEYFDPGRDEGSSALAFYTIQYGMPDQGVSIATIRVIQTNFGYSLAGGSEAVSNETCREWSLCNAQMETRRLCV